MPRPVDLYQFIRDEQALAERIRQETAKTLAIADKTAAVAQGAATPAELVDLIFDRAAPGEVYRGGKPKRRLSGGRHA
jgi:hypothetical protein